eukprot:TRINITY_DN15738_c0_g1_i2.p1 TRINITY_DN15738_c0_g1~~TRINITY_DN15738_c0_g1_i2.p1  ORF type:complete len:210 (+),score=50.93 TRINITY_DN15738_c0_g1_i2:187-816(+)
MAEGGAAGAGSSCSVPASSPRGAMLLKMRAEENEKKREYERSLQLPLDERYKKMDHYRNHGGSKNSTGHYARLMARRTSVHGGADGIAEAETNVQVPGKKAAASDSRVAWQMTFERSVNRLMEDFDLTDVPQARFNHLDRMDTWFTMHGAKQAKKGEKAPDYLRADQNAPPPPGSARTVAGNLGGASLALAGVFVMGSTSPRPSPRKWV